MRATVTIDYGDGTIEHVTISDAQLADLACGNCGTIPCSHQCPRSVHYYTIEQERYDDAHGYHDQYDGWDDPDLYADGDDDTIDDAPITGAQWVRWRGSRTVLRYFDPLDDIPF